MNIDLLDSMLPIKPLEDVMAAESAAESTGKINAKDTSKKDASQ
jgi:hypothetical protein